ncbi:MAG: HD domain-containing protein [Bacteriovorax sp.]|nr:HD domain-containing protein [Bacteriovorax sp.]
MKAPEWRQNVLLVSDDPEIKLAVSPAFGEETHFISAQNTEQAIAQLDASPIHVIIIDAKTTNPNRQFYDQYYEEKDEMLFVELSQYASQLNHGLTIILLVNKLLSKQGDFARKCGAVLSMDRKNILINRMIYLIGVLRKRTFRTILSRDIPEGTVFSVDLYHYLSLSERYAIFLQAGVPFSAEKMEKIKVSNIRHLYVQESDLGACLSVLRDTSESLLYSESLASIRNQYRQLLIQIFDISTDGMLHFGKDIYEKGLEIAAQLEKLISRFPDPVTSLRELPYPRWSAIAHSLNCGIYAIIFSKHCHFEHSNEIAFAAMIHNIGFSEIDQDIIRKNETELSSEELEQYKKHVTISLELLRKKLLPFTPLIESIILHHHENFDGTGFPDGLAGENLPLECALVSIFGSFDYFNTVRPGEKPTSAFEAWQLLKKHHGDSTQLNKKFHPKLLVQLEEFFVKNFPEFRK